jgi:geranylgeranyl pyrophosphate synthase
MKAAQTNAITMPKHARALSLVRLDPSDLLAKVESRMAELAGDPGRDPGARMANEHLETGGKRLRARLALAACETLGARAEEAVDWAAAVELLHNASLVHDDLQDGDPMRRGKPALWARYGPAQAINVGDLMLMLPFRALRRYPAGVQAALVQILAEQAESTARGQIRELALTASPDKGWSDYFGAASGKTGTLFALPIRGAAVIAGLEAEKADDLAAVFSSIGVLYQLQDDLLDLFDAKGRGSRGSDIYEGRLSAVVLTHLELHREEAREVFELLRKTREETTQEEVCRMIARFIEGGAAKHLLERIHSLAAELLASEALRSSPGIHAVARELIQGVLAPLDVAKGGSRG